eukprot:3608465-Alexandrium_andersonii.AAC.1
MFRESPAQKAAPYCSPSKVPLRAGAPHERRAAHASLALSSLTAVPAVPLPSPARGAQQLNGPLTKGRPSLLSQHAAHSEPTIENAAGRSGTGGRP